MSLPLDNCEAIFGQPIAPQSRDCPLTSATSTYTIGTVRKTTQITRVELIVDATYAADPANFYVFTLVQGATTAATWSTQTGQEGAITGGTPASMTLSVPANLVVPAGTKLALVATKAASGANITPRVVVYGRTVG